MKAITSKIIEASSNSLIPDIPLRKYTYPDVYIPNRTLAYHISFEPEDSADVMKLKQQINDYNEYIDYLLSIPKFTEVFKSNNYELHSKAAEELWPKETVEKIFSIPNTIFSTQLDILDDVLINVDNEPSFSFDINGEKIQFTMESSSDGYPDESKNYYYLWGWYSDLSDVCCNLYNVFEKLNLLPTFENEDNDFEPSKQYFYEFYDQIRGTVDPDPNIMRCLGLLIDYGYMELFSIHPDSCTYLTKYRAKEDSSIDFGLLNKKFIKDQLLVEKIKLILALPEDEIPKKKYFLTSADGKQYLSETPGEFGGHRKLKIYGKLDCPSAARYIAKGQYVQHRVFFADQETAVAAGYRPCGVCMKEEYKKWKESQRSKE